ncbi:hypothetical protein K492DRAFT_207125 [Lichtheimia hyalospora FSU 10163]|nr:hypothetical protein K492DRAFT_207125 [Lichtheimia hyalospora FSU 10163]
MPLKTLAVAAGESLQSPSFHSKNPQPPSIRSPHNDARCFQPDSLSKQALTTDQPIHVVHEEEDFYTSLEKHSAMYRIVLDRPLSNSIPLDEWVRLDLQLVNEYGLVLRKERVRNCNVSLQVKLLLSQSNGYALQDTSHYQLEMRPVRFDNWDTNSDTTSINTYDATGSNSSLSDSSASMCSTPDDDTSFIFTPDVVGFQSSGKGSLEFRITGDSQYTTKTKYFLYIAPTAHDNAIQALPSVVGPVQLVPQEHYHPTLQDRIILSGVDTEALNRLHRVFDASHLATLNNHIPSLHHKFFVVKENWKMATWGKAWDAALVLSDMLAKRVVHDPDCLSGRHVIDISAGTGCAGLLVAFLLRQMHNKHNTKITLTDLPEALQLIKDNHHLNFGGRRDKNVYIEQLRWGSATDAKTVLRKGKADIILASDVLYETSCFPSLVHSLVQLCTPGKTVIYLGYKRRGLNEQEERIFFDKAAERFHIELVGKEDDQYDHVEPTPWEKEHGVLMKSAASVSENGWVGRLGPMDDFCSTTTMIPSFGSLDNANVKIYRMVLKRRLN